MRFFIGNDEARSGLFFASDTVQLEVLIATCHEGAKSHDWSFTKNNSFTGYPTSRFLLVLNDWAQKMARLKSIFDAWACLVLDFLMLDAKEPLKIGQFWQKQCIFSQIPRQKLDHVEFSNAQACSSSKFYFWACSNLLGAQFFHTRCNTNYYHEIG